MRRGRKTKIVATLGPASSSPAQLKALFQAGADVFRVNMSHTSHDGLRDLHGAVRALEAEMGRPIAVLVDLQGPKIRLGSLPGGAVLLKDGARIRLVREAASTDPDVLPIPHAEVFAALKQKHGLMIDDGKIRLRTFAAKPDSAEAIVEVGGWISDKKGINLPDTLLPLSAMTDKDRGDLDDMVERAARIAYDEGFASAGERIVITAGVPLGTPGATNFMRIAYVGEEKAGD